MGARGLGVIPIAGSVGSELSVPVYGNGITPVTDTASFRIAGRDIPLTSPMLTFCELFVPPVVPVAPVVVPLLASGEPNWPDAAIGAIPSLRNFRSWFFNA